MKTTVFPISDSAGSRITLGVRSWIMHSSVAGAHQNMILKRKESHEDVFIEPH